MADPEAAVAILHARPADSVLLMRRAEREGDSWSGHWSFPGGRRDAEDPDSLYTALRELEEECGIRLGRAQLQSELRPTIARRRVGRYLMVAAFVFCVDNELPSVLDPREAVEAIWVPLSLLRDPARHKLQQVPGVPPEMRFPAIGLRGVPLWGFTYRLIAEWLHLNPPDRPMERAGFQVANGLLSLLVASGLRLRHGWEDHDSVKVAAVDGVIPVAQILAHASAPAAHIPAMNSLEVRPELVRVVGLAFEEYVIQAAGGLG